MLKLVPNYKMSFIEYPRRDEWCTALYTIGCPHGCEDCHNQQLQDPNYNAYDEFTILSLLEFMQSLASTSMSNNFTIMGGEPLAPWNIEYIKELLTLNSKFNICIYTGYEVDYVKSHNVTGFTYLKTGRYDKNFINPFVSSTNLSSDFILSTTNQKVWDENFNLISNNGIVKGNN